MARWRNVMRAVGLKNATLLVRQRGTLATALLLSVVLVAAAGVAASLFPPADVVLAPREASDADSPLRWGVAGGGGGGARRMRADGAPLAAVAGFESVPRALVRAGGAAIGVSGAGWTAAARDPRFGAATLLGALAGGAGAVRAGAAPCVPIEYVTTALRRPEAAQCSPGGQWRGPSDAGGWGDAQRRRTARYDTPAYRATLVEQLELLDDVVNFSQPLAALTSQMAPVTAVPLTYDFPANRNATEVWEAAHAVRDFCRACPVLCNINQQNVRACLLDRLPTQEWSLTTDDSGKSVFEITVPGIDIATGYVNQFIGRDKCSNDFSTEDVSLLSHIAGAGLGRDFVRTPRVVFACMATSASMKTMVEASITAIFLVTLLPLFVSRAAADVESGVMVLLELSGVSQIKYIVANGVFDFLVYVFALTVLFAFGIGFNMTIFTDVTGPLLTLYILNGFALIAIAYSLAFTASQRASAVTWSYTVSLLLPAASVAANLFLFVDTSPFVLNIIPPFAVARAVVVHGRAVMMRTPDAFSRAATEAWRMAGFTVLGTAFLFAIVVCQAVGPAKVLKRLRRRLVGDGTKVAAARDAAGESLLDRVQDADDDDDAIGDDSVGEACLVARRLRKAFGDRVAVDDVSFDVRRGECFGLLGVNGAGKTTLLRLLSGELTADRGDAAISGFSMRRNLREAQARVGTCPQFDRLFEKLTTREHVLFFTRLGGRLSRHEETIEADDLVRKVGLQSQRSRFGQQLSGGQKRRLSLAIALCGAPDVVFLDEPSSALDVAATRQMWSVIAEVAKKRSVLITTHDMNEADTLCDRVAVLHYGELLTVSTPAELKQAHGLELTVSVLFADSTAIDRGRAFIEGALPTGARLVSVNRLTCAARYAIAPDTQLSLLFSKLERGAATHGVATWSITEPSLEATFLALLDKADAERGDRSPARSRRRLASGRPRNASELVDMVKA